MYFLKKNTLNHYHYHNLKYTLRKINLLKNKNNKDNNFFKKK